MPRNIQLIVEYDGTDFCGFQIQKNGRTVHAELLRAVNRILDSEHKLILAARTDSGVHASGQSVNFWTDSGISVDRIRFGVNAVLPPDVSILCAREVPETFHARFSARSRSYRYSIWNSPHRSVIRRRRFWHFPGRLDREAMVDAVGELVGERDFSSFRAIDDLTRHSVRRMIRAEGVVSGDEIHFEFEANAFLQHMIRNIVGTMIMVGTKKIDRAGFRDVIEARDRRRAGQTAPPIGLCLLGVHYPLSAFGLEDAAAGCDGEQRVEPELSA